MFCFQNYSVSSLDNIICHFYGKQTERCSVGRGELSIPRSLLIILHYLSQGGTPNSIPGPRRPRSINIKILLTPQITLSCLSQSIYPKGNYHSDFNHHSLFFLLLKMDSLHIYTFVSKFFCSALFCDIIHIVRNSFFILL